MAGGVKKTFFNGSIYEGKINEHSQAEGFGILKMADGSYFEGDWFNNQVFGNGKYVKSSG